MSVFDRWFAGLGGTPPRGNPPRPSRLSEPGPMPGQRLPVTYPGAAEDLDRIHAAVDRRREALRKIDPRWPAQETPWDTDKEDGDA
jgi:hypothetical protein